MKKYLVISILNGVRYEESVEAENFDTNDSNNLVFWKGKGTTVERLHMFSHWSYVKEVPNEQS